ncbi:MAG: diphthine-ammonia ligase, partial [Candidatus Woesearchaeota archaeon]|nr:diphthine-ammonia ligase [Candidatus Woesearchaeota archaeon]
MNAIETEKNNNMNAAVLFSGGKDSVYALHLARISGFNIRCLIIMLPESNESMLFHYPFTHGATKGAVTWERGSCGQQPASMR